MPLTIVKFADFQLDLGRYELRRGDQAIKLENTPMKLLILLVERKGQLVTRAEIIQRLWGDNVFVDTRHGINTAVHKLRTALGDDSENPQVLQTVVGKGYKLIGAIEWTDVEDARLPGPRPNVAIEANTLPFVVLEVNQENEAVSKGQSGFKTDDTSTKRARLHERKIYWLLLTLFLCIGLTISVYLVWRHHTKVQAEKEAVSIANAPVTPRRSIAVMGFQNLSGRPSQAWISALLAEMITNDLAAGEELRVVSGEEVARAKVDLSLPEVSTYAPDTLARLRNILSADYVLLGSYSNQAGTGNVRLDVHLQETATGELVTSITDSEGIRVAKLGITSGHTDARALGLCRGDILAASAGALGITY